MTEQQPPPSAAARPERPERGRGSVIVRARPKVVFLYPTFLAALLAGIWTWIQLGQGVPLEAVSLTPGRIFWWVFAINLAAMAFDFTRGEFVALVLFFGVISLGIVLLDERWAFVAPVRDALSHVQLRAHPHLYLLIALALGVLFLLVFLNGRFDYWEITHNELQHHHGVLSDVERYPAQNVRMTKEIPDLFEYCLLGAGRLVIQPPGATRAIVLENVILVNRLERQIQHMLAQLAVTIDAPHTQGDA